MPECQKCGEHYSGNDCQLCKTAAGINLNELAGGAIVTSLREADDLGIYLEDAATGQKFSVALPMCKVGRDPQNDIIITGDNGVSRNQFVISYEHGYFYLMDLGSRNGTLLNGRATTERTSLTDGDKIQLGTVCFRFLAPADVALAEDPDNFLRYFEGRQESAETDTYAAGMTMDTVMPEEVRTALERSFNHKPSEGGRKMTAKQNQELAEEITEEAAEVKSYDDFSAGQDESGEGPKQGAKREMTTKEECVSSAEGYCPKYIQEEIARLEKEITTLNSVVHEAKKKIQDCEGRIKMMVALQRSLLSATGDELAEACARVLQLMGWRVNRGEKDKHELVLSAESGGYVIAGISWSPVQSVHADLGKLVISQVFHWCKQKSEPKGVLIVNAHSSGTAANTEFSSDVEEYARSKNVCVMTTLQLLYMFRELNQSMENGERFQKELLTTTGVLHGFGEEVAEATTAAA